MNGYRFVATQHGDVALVWGVDQSSKRRLATLGTRQEAEFWANQLNQAYEMGKQEEKSRLVRGISDLLAGMEQR